MTTADILTGIRPVSFSCFEVFAPFYEERAKHYVYPRYMQSVCALLDMGKCYYNIIRAEHGKVLVVYKRTQIFGKTGVQMPICPISLTDSMLDEQAVMLAALKVGISLRVTNEDIMRYRIPRNILSDGTGPFVPVNNEYIYDCEQSYNQIGAKYKKVRHLAKRTTSEQGFSYGLIFNQAQADAMITKWGEEYTLKHGEKAEQTNLWAIIKKSSSPRINIRCISYNGNIESMAVYEKVSTKHYIRVLHIRNRNGHFQDTKCAMHKLTCGDMASHGGKYLNIGLADYGGADKF